LLPHYRTSEYRPHLSAVYGDLPQTTREAIVSELGALLPIDLLLTNLSIVDTTGDDPRQWTALCPSIHLDA
jgi:hypothetical protein